MNENESPPPSTPDAGFETLWARVLEAWDDPKTHGALLEYAIQKQLLPEAAGRYRALRDDPEKGADAKKRLEGIVVASTSLLMATATPRSTATSVRRAITAIAFVLCVFVLFFLAYTMLRR